MSKSIIEKLGVTRGQWEASGAHNHIVFSGMMMIADCSTNKIGQRYIPENTKLIATAPELLEVLIDVTLSQESVYLTHFLEPRPDIFQNECGGQIDIIQKATGKTWEEIKELL